MQILKLDEESILSLNEIEEAGIDYWVVTAKTDLSQSDVQLAIRGNGTALPFDPLENAYSLIDLIEGQEFPQEKQLIHLNQIIGATSFGYRVFLPKGYVAAHGAYPLLGSITLSHPTRFFRYTSTSSDSRYNSGQLSNGTYLTSINDKAFVNSGFGAVGRYALPMPIPASHEHDYTLPAGTKLLVGTVAPLYGQSGGGVEVMTTSTLGGVAQNKTTNISDY